MSELRVEVIDLRRMVQVLKGALAVADVAFPDFDTRSLSGLTNQELALIGALMRSGPDYLSTHEILAALPSRDHVIERGPDQVVTVLSRIRKKLGPDVIENRWGRGYRLSETFRASLVEDSGVVR